MSPYKEKQIKEMEIKEMEEEKYCMGCGQEISPNNDMDLCEDCLEFNALLL